ncbi:MAG: HAMP domain-containing histidine kinase [Actinomycetota bacterium]|nr:HAMP domain-containing histidine kinase [Actinomycetota bacterium]
MTTQGTTTESAPASPRVGGLSVRTRITVAVSLLVGLALAGAGLVVYGLESAHIEQEVSDQIEQELTEFQKLKGGDDPTTGEAFASVPRLIELFLARNVPDDDEQLIGFWDGEPKVVTGTRYSDVFRRYQPFQKVVNSRLEGGGTERLQTEEWGEVVVTVQPVVDDATAGALVIVNFLRDEHTELNRVITTYAIVSVLSLGLITGVAAWQAGRLLRPVRALRETAQEITETDLSRRLPETGRDDISALTRTFNQMLARLDRAFTGQREFLDDAGHELKTPLTVIRGHMELLDSSDPADVEDTKALLLDEIDRMSRLVADLMMLAKTDRPDFFLLEPVDVAAFTETVLDKCRALGEREWQLDETAEVRVELDAQRITQALLQLAQNAVKHTEPGALIAVGSRMDARCGLRLWVRDTGRGVRDEDKPVIFQRFGRGAVPKDDEGFGLGLSIVQAIATAHGGTATVEDAAPQGARFVLTLPMAHAARREGELWRES